MSKSYSNYIVSRFTLYAVQWRPAFMPYCEGLSANAKATNNATQRKSRCMSWGRRENQQSLANHYFWTYCCDAKLMYIFQNKFLYYVLPVQFLKLSVIEKIHGVHRNGTREQPFYKTWWINKPDNLSSCTHRKRYNFLVIMQVVPGTSVYVEQCGGYFDSSYSIHLAPCRE